MAELLFESISSEIENKIRRGELSDREKLPSERELALSYGVSRAVVREALKSLAEKSLVEGHVGRGTFVSLPRDSYFARRLESAIDISNISGDDVVGARLVIEPQIVRLAAQNATDEDLAQIRALCAAMGGVVADVDAFGALDAQFHLLLAACTKNVLLKMIASTLNRVTDRDFLFSRKSVAFRRRAHREHQEIVRALEARDGDAVEAAVLRHIECLRKSLGKND
ncbi:MAG: FadR family transcriptional regulator [Oscillospiraceae bacterium]|nr:FadR family transcriptional regulator [Oscillospiraceae bacterium]